MAPRPPQGGEHLSETVLEERGFRLALDAEVYVPAEDTWLLVESIPRRPLRGDAVDMGTGTGAVAIALARSGARRVVAVDVNPRAARLARTNAAMNGVSDRVASVVSDLWGAFAERPLFDRVTFNAPYLPSTPEERLAGDIDRAFHGGDEGVEVALAFLEGLAPRLNPRGDAFVVLSTRGNLDRFVDRAHTLGFSVQTVAEERFFFEAIRVLRLASS